MGWVGLEIRRRGVSTEILDCNGKLVKRGQDVPQSGGRERYGFCR
jgi:hypothetical protein